MGSGDADDSGSTDEGTQRLRAFEDRNPRDRRGLEFRVRSRHRSSVHHRAGTADVSGVVTHTHVHAGLDQVRRIP